jgi:hypothetical protein
MKGLSEEKETGNRKKGESIPSPVPIPRLRDGIGTGAWSRGQSVKRSREQGEGRNNQQRRSISKDLAQRDGTVLSSRVGFFLKGMKG